MLCWKPWQPSGRSWQGGQSLPRCAQHSTHFHAARPGFLAGPAAASQAGRRAVPAHSSPAWLARAALPLQHAQQKRSLVQDYIYSITLRTARKADELTGGRNTGRALAGP